MTTKVSVLDSVRGAIQFARANAPRVAGVLALVMLLNLASAMASSRATQVLTFVATLLVSLMAQGALFRLAFRDEHPGEGEFRVGPQGFQFAAPEARLLGALLLLVLFGFLALLFLLLIVVIFTIAMVATVHGAVDPNAAIRQPDVQAMLAVMLTVFAAVLLWVAVRVCLYPAATVAERKVQVFSTWRLTAGVWWRVFAALVLIVLPAFVMDALVEAARSQPAVLAGFAILSAAVNAFVELPLFCGLYAELYKRLRAHRPLAVPPTAAAAPTGLAGPWG